MSRLVDEYGNDLGMIVETSQEDSADPEYKRYIVYVLAGDSDAE
jgi:hypothetical protein